MISAIENQRWVRVIWSRTYDMVAKTRGTPKVGLMKFISTLTDCLLNQDGREYTHWRSTWQSYLMTYGHTWWTLRRLAQLDHWMTDIVAKCKCYVIDYVMQGESFTFMVLDYGGSIKKMKQIAGSHQWWWCIYDIHVMNVLAKQVLAVVTKFWTSHVLWKPGLLLE